MAIQQEINTVSPARPGLQSVPDKRTTASYLPQRWSATITGAIAIVVGAWGGIAPYIGHALHYSADGSSTWTWNLQHGVLSLLPGAMAVVAGALVVAIAWRRPTAASVFATVGLFLATVLVSLSAVWFLIGTSVWPIYFTSHVFVGASPVRSFANVVGTYLAEGFVLAAIGGVVGTSAVRALAKRSTGAPLVNG